MSLVTVNHVRFGHGINILLEDVVLGVDEGQKIGLVGRNGCGKSTLLKLLAGALPPLTGTLAACGVEAATSPLDQRRNVFWCGPGAVAFNHLRPLEYASFLQSLYPYFDATALPAWLQGFGLEPFLETRLAALSLGN